MIFKGLKFGMILQLAIGPVCLFIFKIGGNKGFIDAEIGVLGVAVIDALYILLAITGTTSFLDKERTKHALRLSGALIVGIFGLQTILGIFGWGIIPNLSLLSRIKSGNSFVEGIVLTASNPLTILFWAGVFSTKIAEDNLRRKEVYLFGLGSILATLFFLTIIAAIGSISGYFLPVEIISILNFIVGLALIYFAFKMIMKRG